MIRLERVRFDYEEMRMEFSLAVPRGAFVAVTGPSGGGKSTLLSLIAGFETPVSGRVLLDGADMAEVPPGRRPVSTIFQDHNTFAHLNLWNNVALGISPGLRLDASQCRAVDDALAKAGLAALRERKPGEVSGGERQRVGIARALVRDKPILLLDEPFASLGPSLRREMLDLMLDLHKERSLTVLMVTHQPEEARHAASHVAFVEAGRILAFRETPAFFASRDVPEIATYLGGWRC